MYEHIQTNKVIIACIKLAIHSNVYRKQVEETFFNIY